MNVFQPSLGSQELAAIEQVMTSNWIGRGTKVAEFEEKWAAHVSVSPSQVISTNSCTEALFQVLELIDVMGQEVIIPSIHFIGAANAIVANYGRPVFCDVDPYTLQPSVDDIGPLITPRTRAIILLHYGGYPGGDTQDIIDLARSRGIMVIEDAAHAPASKYRGKACGTLADFGVWSFDAMKIMSTGDGGMIYTANPDHRKKLDKMLYLGLDMSSGFTSAQNRWWEYGLESEGRRRSIMNDMTAALGLVQLKRLPAFIEKRQELVSAYLESPLLRHLSPDCWYRRGAGDTSSYYFFWIQTDRRDDLAKHLRSKNIYTTFRYFPLHRVFATGQLLVWSELAADTTLLLPLHQGMSTEDVVTVTEVINDFLG